MVCLSTFEGLKCRQMYHTIETVVAWLDPLELRGSSSRASLGERGDLEPGGLIAGLIKGNQWVNKAGYF